MNNYRKDTELDCDFGDCPGILTREIEKADPLVRVHIERMEDLVTRLTKLIDYDTEQFLNG